MKKLVFLFALATLMSCSDDHEEEATIYSFDKNGKIIISNNDISKHSAAAFDSLVCGKCWKHSQSYKINESGHVDKKPSHPFEDINGNWTLSTMYLINKDSTMIYYSDSGSGMKLRYSIGTTYDEITGNYTDENGNKELTIISITADSIIVYNWSVENYQLSYKPISVDEQNHLNELYKEYSEVFHE